MAEHSYVVFHLLSFASMLLAACSIHKHYDSPKSQTSLKWCRHQQSVATLTCYQARGVFAYLSKEQKVYARFKWQQTSADRYYLILINPFGRAEISLNVQLGVAQIINNQGKRYVSSDPEMIIQKLAGISIPINDLHKWILGLPGDATNFTIDARGYLHQLNYSHNGQHWTVTYHGYHDNTVPALPSNLELRQGNNYIKLKLDNWSL